MSAAMLLEEPVLVRGDGWRAQVHSDHIDLSVAPTGDPLPQAIAELFAPSQRRYWHAEWTGEGAEGWENYRLERVGLESVRV